MIVRQRSTIADDLLLQVLFPLIDHRLESRYLRRLARYWNAEVRPAAAPREGAGRAWAQRLAARWLQQCWRRLAQAVHHGGARAGCG